MRRRIVTWVLSVVVLLVVPVAAMALSVVITPSESVQIAGQSLEVNATVAWPGAGPGHLQLFGTTIPTRQDFAGPLRPQLRWDQVTHYTQLVSSLQHPGNLGQDLIDGWQSYFLHQLLISVGLALAILAVVLLVLRRRLRDYLIGGLIVLVLTGSADALAISAEAQSARALPNEVHSLNDLVGQAPLLPVVPAATPAAKGITVAVIGDSTAAGAGNPLVANPTPQDTACERSRDSYAADIAAVNQWKVVNLACTNATIADGLFGPEMINGQTVPPQLSRLESMSGVRYVIVSIGANEMQWHNFMDLCLFTSTGCNDAASAAWFSQALDSFDLNYYDLLQQLAALPGHPRVIINEYYAPLPAKPQCPSKYGVTSAKVSQLLARLQQFNQVLAQGAQGFGFAAVTQDFSGHELCTAQSWIQGPTAPAPVHPTAAGELAIALADEQVLLHPSPTLTASASATVTSAPSGSPASRDGSAPAGGPAPASTSEQPSP